MSGFHVSVRHQTFRLPPPPRSHQTTFCDQHRDPFFTLRGDEDPTPRYTEKKGFIQLDYIGVFGSPHFALAPICYSLPLMYNRSTVVLCVPSGIPNSTDILNLFPPVFRLVSQRSAYDANYRELTEDPSQSQLTTGFPQVPTQPDIPKLSGFTPPPLYSPVDTNTTAPSDGSIYKIRIYITIEDLSSTPTESTTELTNSPTAAEDSATSLESDRGLQQDDREEELSLPASHKEMVDNFMEMFRTSNYYNGLIDYMKSTMIWSRCVRPFAPEVVISKTKETDNVGDCCICLLQFENGDICRTLPCQHNMHKQCIDTWFQENTTCPMCRCLVFPE